MCFSLEFAEQLPGQFEKTLNQIAFYNVEIYRSQVIEVLEQDSENVWVNSEEICNGLTDSGARLNPLIPYLVNRSSVIQSWDSFTGQ